MKENTKKAIQYLFFCAICLYFLIESLGFKWFLKQVYLLFKDFGLH